MASAQVRAGKFRIQFRFNGRRESLNLGKVTERAAAGKAAKIEGVLSLLASTSRDQESVRPLASGSTLRDSSRRRLQSPFGEMLESEANSLQDVESLPRGRSSTFTPFHRVSSRFYANSMRLGLNIAFAASPGSRRIGRIHYRQIYKAHRREYIFRSDWPIKRYAELPESAPPVRGWLTRPVNRKP